MIFYASPAEEAGALRRAVARAGCVLRSVSIGATDAGDRALGEVVCEGGWGAARLVMALAAEDARTVGARALARSLRGRAPDDLSYARAVHGFVRGRLRFRREAGEVFQGPGYALAKGEGDCEDHSRVVYALAVAGGLPARLAFLHDGGGPTHAVAQLLINGRPTWAETTVDAELGEHPVSAARRLGLRHERGDIKEGVRVMTEKDLVPVPAGFASVNDPSQVRRDAQALVRLGYLAPCDGDTVDPADPVFRRAVVAFQRDRSIVVDGLIGPQTRRTIAGVLPLDDFGLAYMGALAAAPAIVHTKHLSPKFFRDVEALARRFRARGSPVTAEDFMSVWLGESGIGLHRQGHGGLRYYGLNMMHWSHLRTVGWTGTEEEYRDLPLDEQIPYVERFYDVNVRWAARGDWSTVRNASDLYFLNFVPAWYAHHEDPEWVISARDGREAWIYTANPALDVGKKGFIEVADLQRWIDLAKRQNAALWSEAVRRLRDEGGAAPPPPPLGGSAAAVGIVILVGLGLAANHVWG